MPLTVADLKTHLVITTATHDTELTRFLSAASNVVADLVGPLAVTSFTERRYGFTGRLLTRNTPVVAVTSVSKQASPSSPATTYATAALTVDTELGLVRVTDGSGLSGDVTITYTAGFSTVPAEVELTILELAAFWWRQRKGGSETYLPAGDDGTRSFVADAGNSVPTWVKTKLRPYLRAPNVG